MTTVETFREFLIQYGTGFPGMDISILATFISLIALSKALTIKPKLPPELDRVKSLLGKVDKLEREIGELRKDVFRELAGVQTTPKLDKEIIPPIDFVAGEFDENRMLDDAPETTDKVETESETEKKSLELAQETAQPLQKKETETLSDKLSKSRTSFLGKLKGFFVSSPTISPELIDEIEATLISSDLGPKLSEKIVSQIKSDLTAGGSSKEISEDAVYSAVRKELTEILSKNPQEISKPTKRDDGPLVILIVGVNGVGKTTSVAKLGSKFKSHGSSVLFVAADTFRAGAVDQLAEWGRRIGVEVVSGADGAKPQSVVFDGMKKGVDSGVDVVLIDTAGRLHNKSSLMQELEGVKNVIKRHQPSAPHETWLVVDGSTGGNAVSQAREFNSVTPLSGVIVTKLDGTPRGGVVAAIADEIGVPVRYIGVGEKPEDLRPFHAAEFVEALVPTTP